MEPIFSRVWRSTTRALDSLQSRNVPGRACGSAYQFNFGIDLPISNESQRMDYALVTGLTCLF
jgi:hypothetical protein